MPTYFELCTHHAHLHVPTTTATGSGEGSINRYGHIRQVKPELRLVLPALNEAASPLHSAGGALTRLYSWRSEGGQGQAEYLRVRTGQRCESERNGTVSFLRMAEQFNNRTENEKVRAIFESQH